MASNFVGPAWDILKQATQKDKALYVNDVSGAFTLCIGTWSQSVQQYYESTNLGKLVTIKWGNKSASFVPQGGLKYIVKPENIKIVGGGAIAWN